MQFSAGPELRKRYPFRRGRVHGSRDSDSAKWIGEKHSVFQVSLEHLESKSGGAETGIEQGTEDRIETCLNVSLL